VGHMYKYAVFDKNITKFSSERFNYTHQKFHLGGGGSGDRLLTGEPWPPCPPPLEPSLIRCYSGTNIVYVARVELKRANYDTTNK